MRWSTRTRADRSGLELRIGTEWHEQWRRARRSWGGMTTLNKFLLRVCVDCALTVNGLNSLALFAQFQRWWLTFELVNLFPFYFMPTAQFEISGRFYVDNHCVRQPYTPRNEVGLSLIQVNFLFKHLSERSNSAAWLVQIRPCMTDRSAHDQRNISGRRMSESEYKIRNFPRSSVLLPLIILNCLLRDVLDLTE